MPSQREEGRGFWSTFTFLTKVTYGGIIGKIAAIAIVFFLLLCWLIFAGRSYPLLLAAVLIIAFVALVFVVLRIESIFKSNPEMATLEGTEVIKYRQAELRSKNDKPVRVLEITTDPELPHAESPARLGSSEGEDEQ